MVVVLPTCRSMAVALLSFSKFTDFYRSESSPNPSLPRQTHVEDGSRLSIVPQLVLLVEEEHARLVKAFMDIV